MKPKSGSRIPKKVRDWLKDTKIYYKTDSDMLISLSLSQILYRMFFLFGYLQIKRNVI